MPANDSLWRGSAATCGTLSPETACCAPSPTYRGRHYVPRPEELRRTTARFAPLTAAIGLLHHVEAWERRGVKQLTKPDDGRRTTAMLEHRHLPGLIPSVSDRTNTGDRRAADEPPAPRHGADTDGVIPSPRAIERRLDSRYRVRSGCARWHGVAMARLSIVDEPC